MENIISLTINGIDVSAVSYTHLDVYKRQDMACPCTGVSESLCIAAIAHDTPERPLWPSSGSRIISPALRRLTLSHVGQNFGVMWSST